MAGSEISSLNLDDKYNLSASASVGSEALNLTSVNGLTIQQLSDLFDTDQEKFFRYAETKKRRYETKLIQLDPDKCEPEQLEVRKDEVLMVADTLATFLRFIDGAAGLSEDTVNDRLINLETNIAALHGLYLIKVKGFIQKSTNIQSPDLSEKTEMPKEDENCPDVEVSKKAEIETLFSYETPKFLKSKSLIENRCSDPFDSIAVIPENNTIVHQSSTPLRDTQRVRFSDVNSHHTLSDYQSLESPEDSWKFVETTTNHIEEISLVEDLQAISHIVGKKICEDLTDVEIHSMEKRSCKELKQLKINIEKKTSNLPIICNPELKNEAVKAFKAASSWIRSVEDIIQSRGLHLESDHKHVKALELPAFKGHRDDSSNIYEFLYNFSIVSRGFTEQDKSSYLFYNYLSSDIQREVKHVRTNFALMRQILLNRHGNVNTLMLHKKNQIKKLQSIHIRSSKEEKIIYTKSFVEILDQLASLIEINIKDFPNMSSEIFSYSNIMGMSKLLPDFLFRIFSAQYVKSCSKLEVQAISGEQSFEVLVNVLRQFLKELEFTAELFYGEDDEKSEKDNKPKVVKSKPVFNIEELDVNNVEVYSTERVFKPDRYYGAPCLAHKDVYTRVRQCLSGTCSIFLGMNPKLREEKAQQKKVCKTCLLHVCLKRQEDEICLFKDVIPAGMICGECNSKGVIKNILLCSLHQTKYADCSAALIDFLPGYKQGTKVSLFLLGDVMRVDRNALPMKPFKENTDAFDVETGKTIPKTDVIFKIREDNGELAIYPTQLLNLNGVRVCVLWDTGALGELVKREVAEKLDLTILDNKSQSLSVATAQVVSTDCPLFQITLGPNDRDEYHTFPLVGVNKISGELPFVKFDEIGAKVRKTLVSFPESKERYPESAGGGDIDMIIGTRQSHIFPTRIYVLEDGLQIWRSPLKDCFGSRILFSGPIGQLGSSVNLVEQLPTFYQEFHKTPMMADALTRLEVFSQASDEIHTEDYGSEDIPNTTIMNFITNMCFDPVKGSVNVKISHLIIKS